MSKLQSIIAMNPLDYINNNHLNYQQVKAINSIISCQTANMGSHRLTCECGHEKVVHNSCYNRHCPICGNFKKELWIQKQQESLIPNHYFHLVFTIPDSLRSLAYYNQKIIYNLMYSATSKTITDLSKDKLGTIPGFSLILHTWSQTLMFHPHIHYDKLDIMTREAKLPAITGNFTHFSLHNISVQVSLTNLSNLCHLSSLLISYHFLESVIVSR